MKDIQYVMAKIMEDALMKSEFPEEYKQLMKLESKYQKMRAKLYKKVRVKIMGELNG